MNYINADVTSESNFFGNANPIDLAKKYGTPLFVYSEKILRERCRELKNLVAYKKFVVNYSPKANSNIELLKIVKDEGLYVDAMSPGEISVNLKAGFDPDQIFYISNNVNEAEFQFAIDAGVKISVDSVSQLETYGKLNPGGKVAIRINPGVGAGHHKKVVTGGKKTKFGIEMKFIPQVKELLQKYNLTLIGINQHIGSLFMEGSTYAQSTETILSLAKEFDSLEFVDLGGGFGIPYEKQAGQKRLDLTELGSQLTEVINNWIKGYGKEIQIKIEPGRYIVAECGLILGEVNTIKNNYDLKYVGTDVGFNVNMRPILYDSHHDIEIYRESDVKSEKEESVRVVGNICETGDILAKDRVLPEIFEKDIIGVLDSGAYCFAMCSNYNNRLKPAEVLIDANGNDKLIRRRDTIEDLMRNFVG